MRFTSSCFTWSNNRVKERLDWAFCSISWREIFANAFIHHLPKTRSDHCPILMQLFSNNYIDRSDVPFRFQAMWLSHANYADFIDSTWCFMNGNFNEKIRSMASALSKWNNDTFGHLFHKKRRLLARIGGIQKAKDRSDNLLLVNLEADLIHEYEVLRNQENMFWRQKSRDNWIQSGDRNTKFFHLTTLVRWRRNKIEGLFDSVGNWCTNFDSIKKIAVDFFTNLFSQHEMEDLRISIPWLFPDIDQSMWNDVSRPVTLMEIKDSLFGISKLKAPDFDGFPAIFFQHHWSMYSYEIFNVVNNAFTSLSIHAGLNHTIIALIPKIDGPQHMINLLFTKWFLRLLWSGLDLSCNSLLVSIR